MRTTLNAIKNVSGDGRSKKDLLRKILTVFQFATTQILIIATIAVGWQIKFILNKDLGYSRESIIYFQTPWWEKTRKEDQLKTKLDQLPEIQAISIGSPPVDAAGRVSVNLELINERIQLMPTVWSVDTSYLEFYGIELIAGRNFSPNDSSRECVVNEAFLRAAGVSNPDEILGVMLDKRDPVVGVVKDYHTNSLHTGIDPMLIYYGKAFVFGVKLDSSQTLAGLTTSIQKIAAAWRNVYPDEPFDYKFLDDTVKRFYEIELRTSTLSKLTTVIAVCISCLGLFGLSFFTVTQRTKEIGIRKVFGASVNNVFLLLSSEFLKLILAACIVATPLAYLTVDYWLRPFQYRIEVSPWLFIASTTISCLLGFFTIGFQILKAAHLDPVKTLRYE